MAKAKVSENEENRGAIKKFLVTPSFEENKNYLGNANIAMNWAKLSIEKEIVKSIDFENILQDFAHKKEPSSKRACLLLQFFILKVNNKTFHIAFQNFTMLSSLLVFCWLFCVCVCIFLVKYKHP